MATKTINGSYPSGYYLNRSYQTLDIGATANVGGAGVTASSTYSPPMPSIHPS